MNDQPTDPFTATQEGAHQTHELFVAYIDAGFTEAQAMHIVVSLLLTAAAGGQQ